ncbi:DNA-binding HxlR family transcriptional regulator [Methanococcus voltae PS]|uniref:DNA-binding HxlR family transcriptional regulator n=1 Tax=Methanococcus voltae PS TaxID=523842 RepID=A0ABT2EVL1_METVO|nr:MarR family transcriptional regulator [Methanococcus voltae]MCS3921994.1 DNA-binding HxlR family transcriptional regulator [Methanococcus voltae PS]
MDMLKIISKKHVKEIIYCLDENGELYVGQIGEILNVDRRNLSRLLAELAKSEIVINRKEEVEDNSLPKSYYKLSIKGENLKLILDIMNILNKDIERDIQFKLKELKRILEDKNEDLEDSGNNKNNMQSNNTINDNSGFVNTGNIGGNVKFQK